MSYSRFKVAFAFEKDLIEISDLVNSAYRGESSKVGWTTEADLLDGQRTDPQTLLRELKESQDRKILYMREGESGPVLGCVLLERFHDERGVGCYLGMLTVKPILQSQGLGRAILEKAEQYARDWGACRMTLGVIQLRETLMAWYERRGYLKSGDTRPFPYGDNLFGIPKREDLHFVMFEKSL